MEDKWIPPLLANVLEEDDKPKQSVLSMGDKWDPPSLDEYSSMVLYQGDHMEDKWVPPLLVDQSASRHPVE